MPDRLQADIMQSWSGSTEPLVSICCITYNHCHYISQAVNSFLMQETNFPFEILLHDDASTDGTTEIVMEYAKKFPAIIRPIIQTENQYEKGGLINPRFVFPKAKGKYIALCDGDDYWTDCTKLQKQYAFMESNPDYVITYTNCQPFDEHGKVNIDFGGATRDVSSDELVKCVPLYTLTTFFRNVIKHIPNDLLSARLGDQVIWSLLGAYGKGKYLDNIKPAAYRVHDGGVHSSVIKSHKVEATLITYNALLAYYLREDDRSRAQYFSERSILLLRSLIGWNRLLIILAKAGTARICKFFDYRV